MAPLEIPEGYELLGPRGRENAKKAIERAETNGFPSSAVRTTGDGYLIPLNPEDEQLATEAEADANAKLGEEQIAEAKAQAVALPTADNTVAEVDAFAAEWDITLEGGTKAEKIKAIEAEIEARTSRQEAEDKQAEDEGRTPELLATNKED